MKRNITIIVLLLLTVGVYSQNKPVKHALIIAIGNYSTDTTGWPKIHASNDLEIMKKALEFQEFNKINVLQDRSATKDGIIQAITKLISDVDTGDVAVIHISSHGQQVEDYEKDEIDKLDEAIVAYDAPCNQAHAKGFNGKYKGEKHFKDDDFCKLIDVLRIRLGADGDLAVFIDACHSGTGTRGDATVRGGFPELVSTSFKDTIVNSNKEVFLYEKDLDSTPKAHYVVISGSRAKELNYEYRLNNVCYGSLSFALSKALMECDKDATYNSLFAKVLATMTIIVPNQNPTVEGEINRGLFGGNVVAQQPYLTINSIKSPKKIIINGGMLAGIYDSSKVALYPTGTVNIEGKVPLTTGHIISTGTISNTVMLKDSLKIQNKNDAWVFITERTMGNIMLKVKIGSFSDKSFKTLVDNDLKKNTVVEIVSDSAELIIQGISSRKKNMLLLKTVADGAILDTVEKEKLDSVLLKYAQGKFIRELNMKDSTVRIEMEFIPVTIDENKKITFLSLSNYLNNGTPEFDTTIILMIKIKNKGKKDAYFNIIDIQPDGKINAILPSLDPDYKESAEDLHLEPGQETIIKDFFVFLSPPYGKEVFKVLGTRTFIDLSFAISNKGAGKRGIDEQAIEKLFKSTYNNEIYSTSKGGIGSTRITSSTGVNTFDYPFIIKEK